MTKPLSIAATGLLAVASSSALADDPKPKAGIAPNLQVQTLPNAPGSVGINGSVAVQAPVGDGAIQGQASVQAVIPPGGRPAPPPSVSISVGGFIPF